MRSDCDKCQWDNIYMSCTDGSREYARYEHNRVKHPDHVHVFKDVEMFHRIESRCIVSECLVLEADFMRGGMVQCSANVGGDPVSGCDEWATENGLCPNHNAAMKSLDELEITE